MPSPVTELESNSTDAEWVSEHLRIPFPTGRQKLQAEQAQRGEEELAQPVSARGGPPEAALGGWASPSEALRSGHITSSSSGHTSGSRRGRDERDQGEPGRAGP